MPEKQTRKNGIGIGHGVPGPGRTRGVPNRTTAVIKEAVIAAAQAVGEDGKGKDGLIGYLKRVAQRDMKAFCTLLGKVLPTQISAEVSLIDRLSYEDRRRLETALEMIGDENDDDLEAKH
jgi:hypothetical protein